MRLLINFIQDSNVANNGIIDDGARGIVEMLFCTSLIALVGAADQPQSSPRKLQIVNTKVSNLALALIFETRLMAS